MRKERAGFLYEKVLLQNSSVVFTCYCAYTETGMYLHIRIRMWTIHYSWGRKISKEASLKNDISLILRSLRSWSLKNDF